MIITCRECDSRFVLDDKLIKPAGSKVRCSSCKHVFKVFPEAAAPSPVEPPPVVPEPAPVAPQPKALPPEDDLADELDRELDRLFGPDDGDDLSMAPPEESIPAPAPPPEKPPLPEPDNFDSIEEIDINDLGLDDLGLSDEPPEPLPESLDLSDFDLDLSLDDEGEASFGEGEEVLDFSVLEASLSEEAPEEFDLDDMGLSLDEAGDLPKEGVEEDELDFSDLEASLTEAPGDGEGIGEPIEEMELSLYETGPAEVPLFEDEVDFSSLEIDVSEASAGVTDEDDSLDFSDLTLSFDDGMDEPPSLSGDGDLELSLDDIISSDEGGISSEGSVPMELELDLDLGDEEPVQRDFETSLNEELDLSELENLLQEEPGDTAPVSTSDDEIELELDFDYQSDAKTEEFDPLPKEGQEETDFSDIEAMLEKDDKPLDVSDDLEEGVDLDLELELDLSPEVEAVAAVVHEESQSPQMDFAEINDDEPDFVERAEPRSKASKTFAQGDEKGSGLRIFLTLLLVVVLLFAVLGGVYALRGKISERTGIVIPTIELVDRVFSKMGMVGEPGKSDWENSDRKDLDGKRMLVVQDVASRFVISSTLGDLFVITGKVRNNYQGNRHSIRLMGRLFTEDDREVQGKDFFAGNTLTDGELATLTLVDVNERLNSPLGNENINAQVRPGQLVPFMVVFAKPPDDLAKFAVEIQSSKEGNALK